MCVLHTETLVHIYEPEYVVTRIRAAVLSAGAWSASSHLPDLAADPGTELLAVTGRDQTRVADLADRFGAARATSDWASVLAERPDAVIVSSPPIAHEEQVLAALAAGATVLCEKPFAVDPATAWRMAVAAERSPGELLVAFAWSLTPAFERVRDVVMSGEIGDLEHVVMSVAVNIRQLLTGDPNVGWENGIASRPSTYQDPAISGGGAAAVTLSHGFGLLGFLTGGRVRALSARTTPSSGRLDLHDAIVAELELPDRATPVNCVISCTSTQRPARGVEWHVGVYGATGELWYDSASERLRVVNANGRVEETTEPTSPAPSPTQALLAVARGATPPVGLSAVLGAEAVAATDAVYRSAESGGWVTVPDRSILEESQP